MRATARRLLARVRAAGRDGGPPADAGFTLLLVMMVMLLVATLCTAVLTQLVSEIRQTSFSRKHTQTLNTAYAGLNAALSQVRAATTTGGAGTIAKLPCTGTRTTITGSLDGAGAYPWSTDIYYLTTDPGGKTTAQVAAAAMPCPLTRTPAYAYFVSTGDQAALPNAPATLGRRTLHASYIFTTSSSAVYGGQVSWGAVCWDAGSSPAPGTRPTFQTCGAAGTLAQSWYYRADNSVQWYGDPAANLCLDWRGLGALPVSPYLTLETCIGTGQAGTAYDSTAGGYPKPGQMYQELATYYYWQNVTTGGNQGSLCVNSYRPATLTYGLGLPGDPLVMTGVCTTGAAQAVGSPGVGAGAAAGTTTGLPGPTQQLVNLENFSRCLDISQNNPANGLITFPCHQPPDSTKIDGNQTFV